jgi:hypothetical protein
VSNLTWHILIHQYNTSSKYKQDVRSIHHHHEPIQISPRRLLKKDPSGRKQCCNQCGDVVEGLLGIADTDRLEEVEVGGGVDEDNN